MKHIQKNKIYFLFDFNRIYVSVIISFSSLKNFLTTKLITLIAVLLLSLLLLPYTFTAITQKVYVWNENYFRTYPPNPHI